MKDIRMMAAAAPGVTCSGKEPWSAAASVKRSPPA